ncbi:MAG: hypothetical protein HN890_03950 [Polaribacter sp.]|jgi:hypothetical protein|nr:hypothetical protein [Polaribacter sp.]
MSGITIKNIAYRGWEKSIEISNSEIKLIVAPEMGRILHFGFLEGENIFYENQEFEGVEFCSGEYYKKDSNIQAPNVGGNRVLPCSEEYFHLLTGSRHVPDPCINASSYTVSCIENGVILESPISKLLGIQIKRTITISEKGTGVNIKQELVKKIAAQNQEIEKIPLTIWSLSKIKTPNISYLPIQENSVFENGFMVPVWPDSKNNATSNIALKSSLLEIKSSENLPQKVGADAKKWVASFIDKHVFVEQFNFDTELKNTYPDHGTSVTIFGNNLFTELECLSPEKTLIIGEKITYDLSWSLQKIDNKNAANRFLKTL